MVVTGSVRSGIWAEFTPIRDGVTIGLDIADVTEGEAGSGFPTEARVTGTDNREYAILGTPCSAAITEHSREGTASSGERNYRVVGTAACTEPAVAVDADPGQILLGNIAFIIPAFWND